MKIILIMALIGAVLYAIDMLICKISPKAGYIFAIFNLPFLPVGIITFILTQKYLEKTLGVSDVTQYFRESGESTKQKKKKGKSSAKTSQTAAEVYANNKTEFVIPIGTTEIKEKEFENREDIVSVVIPEGTTEIKDSEYKNRVDMISVVIPEGTTEIKDSEYENREDIVSVVIPYGVKRIGEYAFSGCANLKSIVILSGVKEIGYASFRGCEKLTEIEIPAGVTKIGGDAFYGCKNLKTIVIPESVQEIGIGATIGCFNLDSSIRSLIHSKEPRPTAEDLECMYIDPVNPSHPPRTVTIEEVASRLYGPGYGKNK